MVGKLSIKDDEKLPVPSFDRTDEKDLSLSDVENKDVKKVNSLDTYSVIVLANITAVKRHFNDIYFLHSQLLGNDITLGKGKKLRSGLGLLLKKRILINWTEPSGTKTNGVF
jgi:hypothetical protein